MGFHPGHSMVYQLNDIYDRVCKTLDNRDYPWKVFCGIVKDSDLRWHWWLLYELSAYGFKNILHWKESYLGKQKQRVFLNFGKYSLNVFKCNGRCPTGFGSRSITIPGTSVVEGIRRCLAFNSTDSYTSTFWSHISTFWGRPPLLIELGKFVSTAELS